MPTYDFSGKVAFVTGAARGQGRSHALRYAESGADVVAVDIAENKDGVEYDLGTEDQLNSLEEEIEAQGQEALTIKADIAQRDQVVDAVDRAIDQFGKIDILANNAGITTMGAMLELEEDSWDDLIDTDLKSVWLCSKYVGQHMVDRGEGGKIINTSSSMGLIGAPMMGHYSAAKHGVIGLTKTLALELAEHDINVNAVCPTAVNTPLIQKNIKLFGEEVVEGQEEISGPSNLFGNDGLVEAEDVTEAYMWLSSDAARFVTGTAFPVDGGMTAK
jgi:SDR family mycofactocin-dependent oxidoreductase